MTRLVGSTELSARAGVPPGTPMPRAQWEAAAGGPMADAELRPFWRDVLAGHVLDACGELPMPIPNGG